LPNIGKGFFVLKTYWIPAFAGMTPSGEFCDYLM